MLKNLKNSNNSRIFFYDVIAQSNRTSFASIPDPSVSKVGWSGLYDMSSFFEKDTFGFFVNSFSPTSVTYVHDVSTLSGSWGDGPNPTGYDYQLEVLLYPRFESVDISGTLELDQNAEMLLEVFDGNELKTFQQFSLNMNSWSNISLRMNTSSWGSSNLQNMTIQITCNRLSLILFFELLE